MFLTCQYTGKINHSNFKPFMNQLQWDTQQQLHHQVAQDVLHTIEAEEEVYSPA